VVERDEGFFLIPVISYVEHFPGTEINFKELLSERMAIRNQKTFQQLRHVPDSSEITLKRFIIAIRACLGPMRLTHGDSEMDILSRRVFFSSLSKELKKSKHSIAHGSTPG
jgi:hypothetical protein